MRKSNITIEGIDTELLKENGFGGILTSSAFDEQEDVQEIEGSESRRETARIRVLKRDDLLSKVTTTLKRAGVLKVLADPSLVTVSGRPAFFNQGGEFPVLVPQSLGTASIEYKKFGTQMDCLPVVLGNDRIRLEVRPRVSQIDSDRSITIDGVTMPGLRVREIDTAVEMNVGETLVVCGLFQNRNTRESASRRHPASAAPEHVQSVPDRSPQADHAPGGNTSEEFELIFTIRTEFPDAQKVTQPANVE